jgi:YbgC/YbaW family acyl-CoA thioester hydrolase
MPSQFTRSFRVRWSETNANGQVDLRSYLRYLIETAWDWGATGGLSIAENQALGLVWVIRETEFNLYRPLQPNEVFDFKIWLVKWRRVRGTRCFELRLKDGGTLVARGVQQVATLDSQTMRPTPPPPDIIDRFRVEDPQVFPKRPFPEYQIQPEAAFITHRTVEWRDLDSFQHVNNASYAAFAEHAAVEALAALGWPPSRLETQAVAIANRRFQIKYLAPALWGDRLSVLAALVGLRSTGGSWYIQVERRSDGEPIVQCLVDWTLRNQANDDGQKLPADLFQALENVLSGPKNDG